jgi:hypothetical protein
MNRHYHFIDGEAWRQEMPELDREVNNTIDALFDNEIPFMKFLMTVEQHEIAMRVFVKNEYLSQQAYLNYQSVYHHIIDQYTEQIKKEVENSD